MPSTAALIIHWVQNKKIIVIYLSFFSLLCILTGLYSNFFPSANDFWGNLEISREINYRIPATLYHGFYPIGYGIFLRFFLGGNPVVAAYIANIVFGILLLVVAAYFGDLILESNILVFLYILTLSVHPSLFIYINTPLGDIGSAAFSTFGGMLLLSSLVDENDKQRMGLLFTIGMLFGGIIAWFSDFHFS